ncbi:MAG: LacI family DNA-binding transcriptional regulator [Flaviflexus sp.]|uniref:LacI family DNA-binding transcriptional regulator n=1 Tax=Flaviflexus sp. TaxID=1969482 RepID=UPI00352F003F
MRSSRPTQVDVAKRAGVSRQTVSLVVQRDPRVSDASREAVLDAMEELGYRPNLSAQALASSRTGFLGISLSGLDNSFHAELAEELRRTGEEKGLIPFVSVVGEDADEQRRAAERFIEVNVDGLILVSPVLDMESLSDIGRRVPTILLTQNIGPSAVDLVHTDDRLGAAIATRHMVDGGYSPLIHVGYDRGVEGDSSKERIAGYLDVVTENGLAPELVDLSMQSIDDAADSMVRRFGRDFGVCCHNDLIAFRLLGALSQHGLAPGADYGLTGYDNTSLAGFPNVGLTSVDQDTEQLAQYAVELLVERTQGRTEQKNIVLPSTLIPRSSTEHVSSSLTP